MNNRSIHLFNYIYSSSFNKEMSDEEKWEEFEKLCSKTKDNIFDFVIANNDYLNTKKSEPCEDITGKKYVTGKFVTLNYNGEKEFYNFKCNQLRECIKEYGSNAFSNCEDIFCNMSNESIREVLDKARANGLIDFDNKIFAYASDELYSIAFDYIKVLFPNEINLESKDLKTAVYYIYGNQINQNGNGNIATMNIQDSDEELYKLVSEKLVALEVEMNKVSKNEIEEIKQALDKKDKKSLLTKLSELATLGSFVAQMILMTFQQPVA